jgi:hypothetical protein
MPYSNSFTYYGYSDPYQYVYYPSYGWTWLAAPWLVAVGPWPYFGVAGAFYFSWGFPYYYGHGGPYYGYRYPYYGYPNRYPGYPVRPVPGRPLPGFAPGRVGYAGGPSVAPHMHGGGGFHGGGGAHGHGGMHR